MSDVSEKAAKWWRGKLESGDRGDAKLDGLGARIAAMRPAGSSDKEALDRFESALSAKIDSQLKNYPSLTISVDYNPDRFLSDASKEASLDVPDLGWPWKTRMWIDDGKIEVREGYGASILEV